MKNSAIGILAAILALSSVASAESTETLEFEALAAEVVEGSEVAAIAAVLEMGRLRDWIDDESVLATYRRIVADASVEDARTIANYAVARILHRSGRFDEADALIDSMGFIGHWAMIGPFNNEGMSGMAEPFPPEERGIFAEAVQGKVADVRWRTFEHPFETGYFPASDFARPSHSALVYVATEFDLEDDLEGVLSLAVDGAYQVWIDGEPIAAQEEHLGGFLLRDTVPLELDDGRHTLLIKIGGIDGLLGLHARLLDEDGQPIDVEFQTPSALPVAQPHVDSPRPRTLSERLAATESAPNAERNAALALIAHATQPQDPLEPWRAFADAALDAEPGPRALMRIASTVAEDWRRADLMEQAIAIEPTPLRWSRLATVRSRQMGEEPAQQAAQIAQEFAGADDPDAMLVLWASILASRGFARTALSELQTRSEPDTMALRTAWIDTARRAGRPDIVLELLGPHLHSDVFAAGDYDDYYLAMRSAGRLSEFWDWMAPLEERLASMPDAAHQRAWLARADGDAAMAEALLSEAIVLCPGDADLLSVRGNLRMEQNLWTQAAEDYEAALQLRPQDAELRERLAMLQPAEDQFYDSYRVGVEELLATRPEEDSDAAYTQLLNQRITRVFDNGLGSTYVQQAFAVHTRSGADELRRLSVVYTPGAERVEVLSASVIKPNGERIEVAEVQDIGGGSGPSSVYYDVRMRSVDFNQVEEGDVLVYEYVESEIAAQNMFDDYFGDLWFIQDYTPTVRGRYVLQVPESRQLFHNSGLENGVWTESVEGDTRMLELEVHNVSPLPREGGAPGPLELFEHASVSTYQDWDSLADWYWNLVENQLVAGPQIVAEVERIIDGMTDRREMVAAIYGYVVRNTRYVGLEFGIHGYKPYRTTDCFSRRFGDCKDTASLMKVMLGIAGIESHLVLVRTSDLGRALEFPPSLAIFNHVISYVPEFDLFLDGTAGFSGSGELPPSDQGATAVIVRDGEGGSQVTIPTAPASENRLERRLTVDLSTEEPAGEGELLYTGAFAASPRVQFDSESSQARMLEEEISRTAPGVRVTDHAISDLTDIESPVRVELEFAGGDWATQQGDGWIVQPTGTSSDLGNRYAGPLTRTQPLRFQHPFEYRAVSQLTMPPSVELIELPDPVESETDFGRFAITTQFENGVLTTEVDFVLAVNSVLAQDYGAFREFVHAADAAFDRVVRFDGGAQ